MIGHTDSCKHVYREYLLMERGLSKKTSTLYSNFIGNMLELINDDENEIREYYLDKITSEKYSSSYRHNLYYAIKWYNKMKSWNWNVKKPKLEIKRRKNISHERAIRLMEHVQDEPYRTQIAIALYMGLRPAEVLKLCYEDIDWQERTLTISNTKTYRERMIPVSKQALTLIR